MALPGPFRDITIWGSDNASISPDGNMVAFSLVTQGLSAVFVVDLGSGKVFMMDVGAVAMRWCNS
jgi:hypothetical protein